LALVHQPFDIPHCGLTQKATRDIVVSEVNDCAILHGVWSVIALGDSDHDNSAVRLRQIFIALEFDDVYFRQDWWVDSFQSFLQDSFTKASS